MKITAFSFKIFFIIYITEILNKCYLFDFNHCNANREVLALSFSLSLFQHNIHPFNLSSQFMRKIDNPNCPVKCNAFKIICTDNFQCTTFVLFLPRRWSIYFLLNRFPSLLTSSLTRSRHGPAPARRRPCHLNK